MSLNLPFGRYVLLEKLATGGMAELFLAKATGEAGFEKTCVIKRVLPHLAADPEFIAMFLDEARIAARLQHPGIAQVFDLGRVGEDYFYAMEYLAGEDLARVIQASRQRHAPIPLAVAVQVIADAAEALHFAHEFRASKLDQEGVVHRDVSPSNLFLTDLGHVRVLDFGIARAHARSQATALGQVKGKTAYMAPEQLRGKEVDRRVDVWALGVCLYELLSGSRPFQADSIPALALAVCEADIPPIQSLRAEVPEALAQVLGYALERDLSLRTRSAGALRQELVAVLDGSLGGQVALATFMRGLFGEARRPLWDSMPNAETDRVSRAVKAETFALSREEPTLRTERKRRRRRWPLVIALAVSGGLLGATGILVETRRAQRTHALVSPPVPVASAQTPLVARTPALEPPEPPAVDAVTPPAPVLGLGTPALRSPVTTSAPSRMGTLVVSSNVPTRVWLDGRDMGAAPLKRGRIGVGVHTLLFVNVELKLRRVQKVSVKAGMESVVRAELGKGSLTVDVAPWADVFVDGEKLGQTPLAGRPLWEGPHVLRLVSPAGEKSLQVTLVRGQSLVLNETLP